MKNKYYIGIVLIIYSLFLMACSDSTNVDKTVQVAKQTVGEWSFKGSSISGTFTIDNIKGDLTITKGTFNVNQTEYSIQETYVIKEDKLLFISNLPNNLVLLGVEVATDKQTMTSTSYEFDTDNTPTTYREEFIVIKKKL